jgi:hypothetical protein
MENDYRKLPGVNQSSLKKILTSPQAYLKARDRVESSTASHFVFGSLVDDMLLKPKIIDDKYYKMGASSTSEAIQGIVKFVYDQLVVRDKVIALDSPAVDVYILEGCEMYGWQPKWGDEAKLKNIRKSGTDYYNALLKSYGKIIIPEEEYNQATICSSSLKADDFIKDYLTPTQNNTLYKHKIVQFVINDIECKGELDLVYIDHQKKTIRPIDFKTTGKPVTGFNFDFWAYRYDFQAAFYSEGLKQDPEILQLIEDGYSLLNFQYIVVEKDMNNPPLIFTVPDSVISIGWSGGKRSSGRYYEGVMQAIKQYIWHTEENLWDYSMDYYKQNGTLFIEI